MAYFLGNEIQYQLLKLASQVLFPTKDVWTSYCKEIFSLLDSNVQQKAIIKGGCIIDHLIGDYTPTDLDLDIRCPEMYHEMHRFLATHGYIYQEATPIELTNDEDTMTTPIGDLHRILKYMDAYMSTFSQKIAEQAKLHLLDMIIDDGTLFCQFAHKAYVYHITCPAIRDLTLDGMNIQMEYRENFNETWIMLRLYKQISIPIKPTESQLDTSTLIFKLYLVDISVEDLPVLVIVTPSFFCFKQMRLEYYLINLFKVIIEAVFNKTLERQMKRFEKLVNLIFLKHKEISSCFIRELIDCGTNIINPCEQITKICLTGQSGNTYEVGKFSNKDVESNINLSCYSYHSKGLIANLINFLELSDLQLLKNYRISIDTGNVDIVLETIKTRSRKNMIRCFNIISKSPYFHEICILYCSVPMNNVIKQ